jgi:hypothetical protein
MLRDALADAKLGRHLVGGLSIREQLERCEFIKVQRSHR